MCAKREDEETPRGHEARAKHSPHGVREAPPLGGNHSGNTAFRFSPPTSCLYTSSLGDRMRVSGKGLPGDCCLAWREVECGVRLGSRGLTSAYPLARRARLSHGERRAALAGPVHPSGQQLCRHRRPVLRVPAEGPGRPRTQGQCWSWPALGRVISAPGNGGHTVRLGPGPLPRRSATQKRT